jgi:hypothetical protein
MHLSIILIYDELSTKSGMTSMKSPTLFSENCKKEKTNKQTNNNNKQTNKQKTPNK